VALIATVTDTGTGTPITPSGTVTFVDTTTNTVLGTATVSGSGTTGTATLAASTMAVGTHTIVATYDGDTDFAAGPQSNQVLHTVTKSASILVLSASDNPSKFGQSVTFKATITSATGGGLPTGTVNFFDGGTLIGTGTVDAAGVAKFTSTALPVGTHTITASYTGDSNFKPSNVGSLSQEVKPSSTTAKLTRSTADAKQPLSLTATILALAPGSGLPTGSVTFVIDGVVRGTVGMTNGTATLVLPNGLTQGTHTIVVKYLGDVNFLASKTGFSYDFGGRST
jgi:hypothetical protein